MFVGVVKVRLENVAWVGMILNFVNRKAHLFFPPFSSSELCFITITFQSIRL